MGLALRKKRNAHRRENGLEPVPGIGAGLKRWARYHRRTRLAATDKELP